MGRRNRLPKGRGRPKTGQGDPKGSLGTIGDLLPPHMRTQLGMVEGGAALARQRRDEDLLLRDEEAPAPPPAPTPSPKPAEAESEVKVLRSGDPMRIAGLVMTAQIEPSEVPDSLLRAVFEAVPVHYRASSERTTETLQELRDALKRARDNSRLRDEQQAQAQDALSERKRTARELGRQATQLREELDAATEQLQTLGDRLATAEAERDEALARVEELQSASPDSHEGKLTDQFEELVRVEISRWLDRRETLLRRVGHLHEEMTRVRRRVGDQVHALRVEIEECESLRVGTRFNADMPGWDEYMDATAGTRQLHDEYRALADSYAPKLHRRADYRAGYERVKRDGRELLSRLRVLIEAFSLIGVPIMEEYDLGPSFTVKMEEPPEVVTILMAPMDLEVLGGDYTSRFHALNSHVVPSRAAKGVREREVPGRDHRPAPKVHLLPGSIFVEADAEEELERMVAVLLSLVRKIGTGEPLLLDEIQGMLVRSTMVRDRTGLQADISDVLKLLIRRRIVSRRPKATRGKGGIGFLIQGTSQADMFVQESLQAVRGHHDDVLVERLSRVVPKKKILRKEE